MITPLLSLLPPDIDDAAITPLMPIVIYEIMTFSFNISFIC